MAGFPIVSIGRVTTDEASYTIPDPYYNVHMICPQFVYDEYYSTNTETIYRNKYSFLNSNGYIKSFTILPNNPIGTSTLITFSRGFRFGNEYGNMEKLRNINNLRLDSFYVIEIDHDFFWIDNQTNSNYVHDLIVNLPNIVFIGNAFDLMISNNIYRLCFNAPKLNTVNILFLSLDKGLQNIILNTPTSFLYNTVFRNNFHLCKGTIVIYSSKNNVNDFVLQFTQSIHIDSSVSFIANNTIAEYNVFDVRYWSKEQNNSGSDR